MPAEVLTYFLKNDDRKLRLGFQIALQCAPFLKGLKVSCVITVEEELFSALPEVLSGMDVSWQRLSGSEGKCLVLFYRPDELREYLKDPQIGRLIGEYGYGGMDLPGMLRRLGERVRNCAERGMGFPHEIGAFLGYPAGDVRGFIENGGRDFLLTGYWKVYQDPAGARMIFKEYDRAKTCAVNEFLNGRSIREIALQM
mgnify:FL=1